jgi:HlyD family secretion protein
MRSYWIFPSILFIAILLTSCSRQPDRVAQGYIEGRYTYMATNVSGRLIALFVDRGNSVKSREELFKLELQPESDIYKAATENLEKALAERDAITANLTYAKLTYDRYKVLVVKNAIQQSALDNARATFDSTTAQLNQADANIASLKATLAQTKWTMDQKSIFSPFDAIVFDTYFRIGEYVPADQAILSLLVPSDIKAIFYIYGRALGSIALNDKVFVRCDGCEKEYTGRISFISPSAEYTPPVIYSNETNVKLVFRIEASFDTKDAYHLHPGQPVRVRY